MTTPELPDNSTLLLEELDIPGRTGPVSETPLVWGINIAAALGNFPKNGLLCRAGPWARMYAGDHVRLFWEPKGQVYSTYVERDEVGKPLQMFIEPKHLLDGQFKASYSVKAEGQTEESSVVMDVLVKLTRPGGHDDNEEPGHSKLIMHIPEEILDGGIDQDNVADGVDIKIDPYPNIAARDVIQVSWGGFFVLGTPLTEAQADGSVPITVHVSEAVIREVGDSDDTGLAVVFEVYDRVDNRSEDWSHEQRVVVAVDASRLDAPILKEAKNNVLDVDALGDANGTAQIMVVNKQHFQVGDVIVVRIKGTPVEGAPVDFEVHGQPLNNVPSVDEIAIPNAVLRQLAKAQIALSYRVEKANGNPDLRSKAQFISVIGQVQRLAAPIVREAVSGALDPQLDRVTLEIPFDKSFAAGQAIKPVWLGMRPDFSIYLPDLNLRPITQGDITAGKPLLIYVDKAHLTAINGGTVEVYYQLLIEDSVLGSMNRVNATHAIRESIHADILQVGEPRLELPEPEVAGVVNGVLPADTDGTTLTVVYLKTVKGDEVVYEWVGSITGKASDSIVLTTFTAGQPVAFDIPAALIKGNEGGTVSASYLIKRAEGGGTSYANPLAFSVGVALELDLKAPTIKQTSGNTLDPLAAKDALTATVDYTGIAVDDEIIVHWNGGSGTPPEGSHTTGTWKVTALGVQNIPLLTSVLPFNLGKNVTVNYTVKRGTAQPVPSPVLALAVQNILDGDTRLPHAVINDNTTDALDVLTLPANALTRVAAWPFIRQGQRLWMSYFVDDNPTPVSTTYTADPLPSEGVAGGVYPATPVDVLKGLNHGTQLRIEFKVSLDGGTDITKAVSFPPRRYNVTAVEFRKPTIESVKGIPSNQDIPPGGTTEETAVTLSGTANEGLQVEVFDNLDSKGTVTADATSGVWTLEVSGLNVAAHSFTAKAKYGANPASEAWGFTVKAAQTDQRPEITKIEDSNGEILDDDVTEDTVVLLTGKALPNGEVEIYDRIDSKGKVSANGSGIWTYRLENLVKGDRIIKAKALYGDGLDSNMRFFTVKESGPELEFDERPASISGFRQIFFASKGFEPKEPFAASYLDRPASGGTPPYSYSCSDDNVAFVNGEGRIYAYKNGVAEITVMDNIGKTKKFKLTTSGSFNEWRFLGGFDQPNAQKAATSAGGVLPSIGDLEQMHKAYKSAPQGNSWSWSSTSPDPGHTFHVLDFSTGEVTNRSWHHEGIGVFVIISN
jgi:hypothetical protein